MISWEKDAKLEMGGFYMSFGNEPRTFIHVSDVKLIRLFSSWFH